MTEPIIVPHGHPVFRVIRAGWPDATDAAHSQRGADNRWNTREFPALCCCCSAPVARAMALDVFRLAAVVVEDLQPEVRPALAELAWTGRVVDVASADGVAAAGFPPGYPEGVSKQDTRQAAKRWHKGGHEGVVCRSASLWRRERARLRWDGEHEQWSKLAIFPLNAATRPREEGRRTDLGWLEPPTASGPRAS
jgi:hypothetical protein